jgi:hypothetical protein
VRYDRCTYWFAGIAINNPNKIGYPLCFMDKIQRTFCRVPEHNNCHGCFFAYEACGCQEFRALFSPTDQLNLLWKKSPESPTAASEQALRLLTVFLHTRKYQSILATGVDWSQMLYLSVSPTYNVTDSYLEIYEATVHDLSNVWRISLLGQLLRNLLCG